MTQQTENPGTLSPSLRTKLQQFAAELTPEEWTQVRPLVQLASAGREAIDGEEVEGYQLLPSLQAKVQQAAEGLTPEDQAQLRLLMQQARAGAAAGDEEQVEGYMSPSNRIGYGGTTPGVDAPMSYHPPLSGSGLPWYGGTAITGLLLFGAFFIVAP
jgi:hypothetical protein